MRTEFDVSDVAWEIYRLMYAENLPKDFKVIENKRKYISEKFKYNTIVSEKLILVEIQILILLKDLHIQGLNVMKIL